ncbi:MAG TPA: hypothetical protein PK864_01255 [Syntrophorhabdaceae bacterium]|nr:hypothetical protein [Syntrophorhabdaceae bacterium]HOL05870.1 hypothetical protein [Syntrophorhabdaceae bacterium]HON84639.1 hypothetical protein [Syntrophorhabdaceae bacterium]HPC67323.1 hypothetical protein [Syntrophorhabdaceae bacterium]HPP42582.1 hypothetical protein [Syntrophorhabdaceae bacterium]
MRDVIEKIVSTEAEAKAVVEKAKSVRDQILSDARKKAQDILEKARQEALIEAENIINAAVEAAEMEKQMKLTHAAKDIENRFTLKPETKKAAIDLIIRHVCRLP